MSVTNDSSDGMIHDPINQLTHDLKTPLTTISAHAQLLERAFRLSPSLADEERARLLTGVIAIETAVREMVAVVDALREGGAHDTNRFS